MATAKKRRTTAPASRQTQAAKTSGTSLSGDVVRAGMDVFDKVVWYSLHALLILVPIAMSNLTFLGIGNGLPLTYDQFDIAKVFVMRAIACVALGAWAFKLLTKGGRIRRTKIDWIIVAFLAWVAISTIFSISPATAFWGKYRRFEGLASFVVYAVVFFLTVQLADRPSRIRSLARSLFIGGVIVAIYGVLQAVGLDPIRWGQLPFEVNRSFSTFGNPDLLGGYLMFPLPVALGLMLSEENKTWRFSYGIGFVFILACWITAFVRGAWIGGAVSLLLLGVVAVWLWRRDEIKFEAVDGAVGGIVVLFAGAFVIRSMKSTNTVMNVVERIKSIFQFGEGSAKTRFEIWEAAANAVKARPITGWGADTFRLVFPMFKPKAYAADAGYLSVADNVHDYPLQLASGIGIPGLHLLYVGIFGVTLYLSIRSIVGKATGPTRYLLFAFWAASVGYITHLFTGLSVTGSTVILWVCLAILLSPDATSSEVEAPSWGTLGAVVALAAVAFVFIYNVVYVVADNHYLQSRISQGNGPVHVAEAQAAVNLNPWNDMYRTEVGLGYQEEFLSGIQTALQSQGAQRQAALNDANQAFLSSVETLKQTIDFVPTEYDNYVFLADIYNKGGTYLDRKYLNDALDIANKAIKDVEPYGPAIRFQAAEAYGGLQQYDKALAMLKSAVDIDPNYGDAYLMEATIYRLSGRLPEAKAAAEIAVQKTQGTNSAQAAQGELQTIETSLASQAATSGKK